MSRIHFFRILLMLPRQQRSSQHGNEIIVNLTYRYRTKRTIFFKNVNKIARYIFVICIILIVPSKKKVLDTPLRRTMRAFLMKLLER